MKITCLCLAVFFVLVFSPFAFAETGTADIQGTAEGSKISGKAVFQDAPEGLKMRVEVSSMPSGMHGIHIHQFGSCADAGNAAGGHYNPEGVAHGYLPKDGFSSAHAGDFGNIMVAADGTGELEMVIPGLTLSGGKYSAAGRSLILHEKQDDFGQPTGNAGARIGCGKILITGE